VSQIHSNSTIYANGLHSPVLNQTFTNTKNADKPPSPKIPHTSIQEHDDNCKLKVLLNQKSQLKQEQVTQKLKYQQHIKEQKMPIYSVVYLNLPGGKIKGMHLET